MTERKPVDQTDRRAGPSGPGGRCPSSALVDRHFAGSNSAGEEQRLRAHLPDCDGCRTRYDRQLLLGSLTGQGRPTAERLARGLGLDEQVGHEHDGRAEPLWRRLPLLGVGAVTLAAVGAVLLLARPDDPVRVAPEERRFAATRPGAGQASRPELQVYRLSPDSPPRPAADRLPASELRPGDQLGFAYRNPPGYRYLMLLAQDARGAIFWFHPAAAERGQDPAAIALTPGALWVDLPEAVGHHLSPGRARLLGLFLDAPLPARTVETRLKAGLSPVAANEGTTCETTLLVLR